MPTIPEEVSSISSGNDSGSNDSDIDPDKGIELTRLADGQLVLKDGRMVFFRGEQVGVTEVFGDDNQPILIPFVSANGEKFTWGTLTASSTFRKGKK